MILTYSPSKNISRLGEQIRLSEIEEGELVCLWLARHRKHKAFYTRLGAVLYESNSVRNAWKLDAGLHWSKDPSEMCVLDDNFILPTST